MTNTKCYRIASALDNDLRFTILSLIQFNTDICMLEKANILHCFRYVSIIFKVTIFHQSDDTGFVYTSE